MFRWCTSWQRSPQSGWRPPCAPWHGDRAEALELLDDSPEALASLSRLGFRLPCFRVQTRATRDPSAPELGLEGDLLLVGEQRYATDVTKETDEINVCRDGFCSSLGLEAAVATGAMGRFFELCRVL